MTTLALSAHRGSTELIVTHYQLSADVSESLRIVHLTDLHSVIYGENNAELAAMVAEQEPDLIFLTGDMLSPDGTSCSMGNTIDGALSEPASEC